MVGIRDPEKKPIPDPGSGSTGQKGSGSRIRIRNTVSEAPSPTMTPYSPPYTLYICIQYTYSHREG
jgi:hypothetical protein